MPSLRLLLRRILLSHYALCAQRLDAGDVGHE